IALIADVIYKKIRIAQPTAIGNKIVIGVSRGIGILPVLDESIIKIGRISVSTDPRAIRGYILAVLYKIDSIGGTELTKFTVTVKTHVHPTILVLGDYPGLFYMLCG